MKTSSSLTLGSVYTRADLSEKFQITDATIRNGIFKPKGHESIWLFVTINKSSDRTQYIDHLLPDKLLWQSQTKGRRDSLIINHEVNGNELIIFVRMDRHQYPGAGFIYEGRVRYISHEGAEPANFTFVRMDVEHLPTGLASA